MFKDCKEFALEGNAVGCHERFVVDREKFVARVRTKGQGIAALGRPE
jgi:hypothetical protein